MSAAHTPGPWAFSFESVDAEWSVITASGGVVIANVNADLRQGANTRLIAAAPDLLGAAIEYLAAGENSMNTDDDIAAMIRFGDAEKSLRAAIAKAEGAKP